MATGQDTTPPLRAGLSTGGGALTGSELAHPQMSV